VVRSLALTTTVIAVLVAAGCGFDEGRDLRPVVEEVMPAHARLLAPCSHVDGLIDYASFDCSALVKGDGARTTQAIATALAQHHFRVACPSAGSLRATRDDVRVTADVTASRVVGRNREGESTCTYTIRNGRGFLRLTARFDGDWHWPRLRRVPRSATFRPNARRYPGDELLEARGV
jgi:hypothetical protein